MSLGDPAGARAVVNRCRSPEKRLDRARDRDRPPRRGLSTVVLVVDRQPAQARAAQVTGASTRWRSRLGDGAQAPVVDAVGDELADIGVHAACLVEEDAVRRRIVSAIAQQVLQHRERGALGVGALRDLRELLRVARRTTLRAEVASASASASDTWPASSMKR